eukprot:4474590-Pleurochrysis_carterae.AAC.2
MRSPYERGTRRRRRGERWVPRRAGVLCEPVADWTEVETRGQRDRVRSQRSAECFRLAVPVAAMRHRRRFGPWTVQVRRLLAKGKTVH